MTNRYQDVSQWKCCCCFELKTGVLILGWLGLIGSVLSFGYEGVAPIVNSRHNAPYLPGLNIFTCVNSLVFFVASAMLIHGVRTDKSSFLRLFMLAQFAEIILGITKAVCMLLASSAREVAIGTIIAAVLGTSLGSYFLYVVSAYYQHLLYREYERLFAPRSHVTGGIPMGV